MAWNEIGPVGYGAGPCSSKTTGRGDLGPQGGTSHDPSNVVEPEKGWGIIPVLFIFAIMLASLVLTHMLGADGEHVVRSLVCIAPAAAISLIGIYYLTHAYWPIARGSYNPIDIVGVWFLAIFITVMILETFAALTTPTNRFRANILPSVAL